MRWSAVSKRFRSFRNSSLASFWKIFHCSSFTRLSSRRRRTLRSDLRAFESAFWISLRSSEPVDGSSLSSVCQVFCDGSGSRIWSYCGLATLAFGEACQAPDHNRERQGLCPAWCPAWCHSSLNCHDFFPPIAKETVSLYCGRE